MRFRLLGIATLLVSVTCALATEPKKDADWSSFRGDPANTGVAACKLPEKLVKLWKFDAGETIESTPAIVGNRVYLGTEKGRLLALKLEDGTLAWEYKARGAISAAPCVAGGKIFVGDEAGWFHAVEEQTGKPLWSLQTRDKIMSSAIAPGNDADTVLVGSYDRRLLCLETATGKIKWSFKADAQVHCSPAILRGANGAADAAVIAGCDSKLRVIETDAGKQRSSMSAGDACGAPPALFEGNAYFGNLRGDFMSVALDTGKVNWKLAGDDEKLPLGSITASAAVTPDAVFIAAQDNKVVRVARKTGKVDWVFPLRAAVESSPVIADQRVFFGSSDGAIYAVDIKTGKELWKFEAGGQIRGSVAVAHDRLVVGTSDGAVYCFGP
jgi:outer membrane protein assembly factor BamB